MKVPRDNVSQSVMQTREPLQDIGLHEKITALHADDGAGSYPIDKLAAHQQNIPHQAISIFIFHEHRLLLQQRALTKYHSGGLWANTVCSHPRWQESPPDCALRRLGEELGWQTRLQACGEISYQAQVGDLFENEHVYCFFGHMHAAAVTSSALRGHADTAQVTAATVAEFLNPLEVAEVRWASLDEIDADIQTQPQIYTPWFRIYMRDHRAMLERILAANDPLAEIEQYQGVARQ